MATLSVKVKRIEPQIEGRKFDYTHEFLLTNDNGETMFHIPETIERAKYRDKLWDNKIRELIALLSVGCVVNHFSNNELTRSSIITLMTPLVQLEDTFVA